MHLLLTLFACLVAVLTRQVAGTYFVSEVYSDDDTCARENIRFIMAGHQDSNETDGIFSPCVALGDTSAYIRTYVALTINDIERAGMEWQFATYETVHCLGTVVAMFYGKVGCFFDGSTRGEFLLDATNFTKIEQEVSLEDYNNTDCPESSNETRTVSYQFDVCSGSQLKNKASLYSAARATGVGIVIMAVLAPLFI